MLVELKNGDTYNGRLVSCDTWMNITLRDVICTSRVRREGEEGGREGRERLRVYIEKARSRHLGRKRAAFRLSWSAAGGGGEWNNGVRA